MRLGNIIDEFHDQDGFAHTSSAKEANFATLLVGGQQVHHLDSSGQDLLLCALLNEGGSITVDGQVGLSICSIGISDKAPNAKQVEDIWRCKASRRHPDG